MILHTILADLRANRSDPKMWALLVAFRLAHAVRVRGGLIGLLGLPVVLGYRMMAEILYSVEIRPRTRVGAGLVIFHGYGIVIHDHATIGDNVTLRHGVTIGQLTPGGACPTIGSNVQIGANATILGPVTVGDGAIVGAGAIVTTDVPAGYSARGPRASVYPPITLRSEYNHTQSDNQDD